MHTPTYLPVLNLLLSRIWTTGKLFSGHSTDLPLPRGSWGFPITTRQKHPQPCSPAQQDPGSCSVAPIPPSHRACTVFGETWLNLRFALIFTKICADLEAPFQNHLYSPPSTMPNHKKISRRKHATDKSQGFHEDFCNTRVPRVVIGLEMIQ